MQTLVAAQQLEGVFGFMWRGICHVYFMSTAMDSWSGFRVHTVIFHHVSAPRNSLFFIQKLCGLCVGIFLCLCVCVCACRVEDRQTKVESNTQRREEEVQKRERESERKDEWRESLLPENRWPPNSQWPHGDLEGQLFAPPGYQRCREGWGT